MIVDVLRNDLGRVCRPGSVRVPRLCRLERTATVQHLVSTVTGRLTPGLDAFDLLAASFPGGSITGAPKIRAMEILEGLEPVRRGPYTGAVGWIGPDGAMQTSIAHPHVRRRRATAHPACRRRDHLPQRPGGGVGRDGGQGARAAVRHRRDRGRLTLIARAADTSGSTARCCPPTARTSPRSIAGSSSATASSRRSARGPATRPSCRAPRAAAALGRRAGHRARPMALEEQTRRPAIAALLAAEGLDGPDGDASLRITVTRGPFRGRGLLPPDEEVPATIAIQAWPVVAAPADAPRAWPAPRRVSVRRDPASPLARSRRRRAPTTSTRAWRPAVRAPTTPCS